MVIQWISRIEEGGGSKDTDAKAFQAGPAMPLAGSR